VQIPAGGDTRVARRLQRFARQDLDLFGLTQPGLERADRLDTQRRIGRGVVAQPATAPVMASPANDPLCGERRTMSGGGGLPAGRCPLAASALA
jgi:hypothetical protein